MTWGAYSSRSSKKICMYRGIVTKIPAFGVDIVGGGEESDAENEASVANGRNPNRAHPGGYSRRDASSWGISYGWGNQFPYRSGSVYEHGPDQVYCDAGS